MSLPPCLSNRTSLIPILTFVVMIFVFGTSILVTPEHTNESPRAYMLPEGRDFAMYWSSWQMFVSGDPLHSLETTRKYRSDTVTINNVLLNPPWCLWLVAPVAWLPYSAAVKAWLAYNFFLIIGSVFLAIKLFRLPPPKPLSLFLLCIFAPSISCWYYGQLSISLSIITCVLLLSLQRKWDWSIGICLALMTIKPHIYFLLAIIVGLYAITQFRWKIFVSFFIAMFILLCPFLLQGSAVTDWIHLVQSGQPSIWMTPTVGTWLRILIATDNSIPPDWPLKVIPALSIITCAAWFFIKRKNAIEWEKISIPLIAFSLICAPYSWAYDCTLLIIWHVAMITSFRNRAIGYSLLALGATVCFFFQISVIAGDMHYLIWYPILAVISWHAFQWNKKNGCIKFQGAEP